MFESVTIATLMKSIHFPQVLAIALLLSLFSISTSGAATPDEIRKALAADCAAKKDVSPHNLIFYKLLSEGKTLDEADAGKRNNPETAKTYEALTPDDRKNIAREFIGKIVDPNTLEVFAKELKLTVENPDPQTPGKCAKCQAQLAAKARFCAECGTPVPQPVQVKACPSCGQKVSGGAFCPNCGTNLKDAATGTADVKKFKPTGEKADAQLLLENTRKAIVIEINAEENISPSNIYFLKLLADGKSLEEAGAAKRSDPDTLRTYELLTQDDRKKLAVNFVGKIDNIVPLDYLLKHMQNTRAVSPPPAATGAPAPPSTDTSTTDDSAELAKINAVDKTGGEKMDAKDYSAAAVDFIEGVNLSRKLAKKHPELPVYAESVFYFANRAASALDLKGDTATALKMELQAVVGYKALVQAKNVSAETKQAAASALGTLAWLQLKSRDPKGAAESARQGMALDPSQVWIKTNLAHALLFNGQFEEASKLYLAERLTKVNDQSTFQDAVLEDFEKFEKAGVKHVDMEKIRVLYGHGTPAAAAPTPGANTSPTATPSKKKPDFGAMAKVVETFLVMLDEGHFAESYDAADASFRKGLTKEVWVETLKKDRASLGAPKNRSATKVDTKTDLGSGKVTYVIPVSSKFEKGSFIEELILVESADGKYGVADWSITKTP